MDAIAREMSGANFDLCSSSVILLEMWEKWVFLATIAGMTCLCVVRLEISSRLVLRIWRSSFWGVQRVAASAGFAPRSEFLERTRGTVTTPGSSLTAPMLRDIERGARIEAEHILGDLVRRGSGVLSADHSLLRLVNMHLKAYEARRKRAQTAAEGVSS